MKYVSWVLIVCVSLAAGQPAGHGTSGIASWHSFDQLVLSPAVSDNIALLFDQFDTEVVLCLEGERRGNDLYITDFRMPHILLSEMGRVQAAGCMPSRRAVGTWHNHPPLGASFATSNAEVRARNCYLSRTDIVDFRRRSDALVTVVSCGPHTFAYWRRGDVESAAEDAAMLPPPQEQLVRSEIGRDLQESPLTQARER
ncbi:MAG: hypothetical protein GTO46_03245 [Gemmatimonadetes bacterium]|nr:hypothetical protein [Gemmatimonadota bacterium]NIO30799.1 hypothetical protein [Gemmatimonadota bacterium]